MHLKRLEIVGFKSFADAFELQFQKGISAIVGPNGCGKSNIADSIRWVLGSQSPRQLRADRMEDVIFSGSDSRKPLGMAEVVLTFDNTLRSLPLDFDEVSVTRRFFRAGEGDYRINGNRCRLMDITDLIVDRGLGSSGYWILEARMVETILSSRPEDRRFLFDEAAGIVKYKIQRHRAELKLDAASTDLDRLNDIVSEVERTVSALRKQVRTFRRFEKAETRIGELEGLIVHRELEIAEEQSDLLLEQDGKLAGQEEGLAAAVSAASARLAESRLELEKAQNRLDEAHRNCAKLDAGIAEIDRDHAVTLERTAATSLSLEENTGRMEWQRGRAGELESMSAERDTEISAASLELEGLGKTLLEAVQGAEKCRQDHKAASEAMTRRREERNSIEISLEDARHRYSEISGERERSIQDLETRRARREDLRAAGESLQLELSEKNSRLENTLEELRQSSAVIETAESNLSGADEDTARIRADLRERELQAGSVRTVVNGLGNPELESGTAGARISDLLSIEEGMEKAVGAYLDGFQDAVVVSSSDQLSGDTGERFALGTGSASLPDPPEGAVPLLRCVSGDIDPGTASILAFGILAPDRETALRWLLDQVPFDTVTPDGSLFRRDGLIRLGVPDSSAGSIDRKAMLDEASRELQRLEENIAALTADLASSEGKRKEIEEHLSGLREKRLGLEREEASLRTGLEGIDRQLETCNTEIDELDSSIPGLEKSIEEATGTSLRTEIDQLRERLDNCTDSLREDETLTGQLFEALSGAQRTESEQRYRVESLEERLKRSSEEKTRLITEAEGATRTAGELSDRIEELEERISGLRLREKELESNRSRAIEQREKAEGERTGASASRAEILESTGELDLSLQAQREELTLLRERRARAGSELETINARIRDLRSREIILPVEGDRFWDLETDAVTVELTRQRGYRENIGPVNMLAVTEFEEAKRRLDYLSEQKEDLQEARESLRQAIDEINRTAATRFAETFVEVRRHFQELFRTLFDGGEADIISLESEDPLEGGVQIMARPKGKKLENVTALSGGERALTAVALLFALYLVKPSPFCILDELDAPLDDSNIDRFVELLRSFSDRTQFVIITHNRRTMEAADRLFGITMAEDGVSVMTSVSLEDLPDREGG